MTTGLLTTKDVANYLRVDTGTVRRYVREGRLGHVRVRNLIRFTPEQLRGFVEEHTVA